MEYLIYELVIKGFDWMAFLIVNILGPEFKFFYYFELIMFVYILLLLFELELTEFDEAELITY